MSIDPSLASGEFASFGPFGKPAAVPLKPSSPNAALRRRVLGIDPGLNVTGYAVVELAASAGDSRSRKRPASASQWEIVEAGVVRGGKGTLPVRLERIFRGISDAISQLRPDAAAVEELFSHYARPRTAILMGHARGVALLAAAAAGIGVQSYLPTQIKRTLTGNGRADKRQMQLAVQRELCLAKLPEPHDVADALAIALCHACLTRSAV